MLRELFSRHLQRGGQERQGSNSRRIISDSRIREILGTLDKLTRNPNPGYFGDHRTTRLPLEGEEFAVWDEVMGISRLLQDGIEAGKVFQIAGDGDSERSVTRTLTEDDTGKDSMDPHPAQLVPFNSNGLRYLMQGHLVITPSYLMEEESVANIGLDLYVINAEGKVAISRIPGITVDGQEYPTDEESHYWQKRVISFSMNKNTDTSLDGDDFLFVNNAVKAADYVVMRCRFRTLKALKNLPIEDDDRMRLFFRGLSMFPLASPDLLNAANLTGTTALVEHT